MTHGCCLSALLLGFYFWLYINYSLDVYRHIIYVFKIYINEMIFMEILGLNPEHTFVNLVAPLYRLAYIIVSC